MRFAIDSSCPTPPSEQLADQVRFAVAAGRIRPGTRLPSVRSIAAEVRVNPNTVSRAWRELERDGVIEARRGAGMFVTPQAASVARSACTGIVEERVRRAVRQAIASGIDTQQVIGWIQNEVAEASGAREAS